MVGWRTIGAAQNTGGVVRRLKLFKLTWVCCLTLLTITASMGVRLSADENPPDEPCAKSETGMSQVDSLLQKEDPDFSSKFYRVVKIEVFKVFDSQVMVIDGKKYPINCDDGDMAEGWSDLVEKIFVTHPKIIAPLIVFMKQDVRFKRFVIDHIDAGWNANDAPKALVNARHYCPAETEGLCREIIKKMQEPS
jgi:hypothetical protein